MRDNNANGLDVVVVFVMDDRETLMNFILSNSSLNVHVVFVIDDRMRFSKFYFLQSIWMRNRSNSPRIVSCCSKVSTGIGGESSGVSEPNWSVM